jgi:hypothetical protein
MTSEAVRSLIKAKEPFQELAFVSKPFNLAIVIRWGPNHCPEYDVGTGVSRVQCPFLVIEPSTATAAKTQDGRMGSQITANHLSLVTNRERVAVTTGGQIQEISAVPAGYLAIWH